MLDSDWFLVIYLDPAGITASFEHPGYADDTTSDDPRGNWALPMGTGR